MTARASAVTAHAATSRAAGDARTGPRRRPEVRAAAVAPNALWSGLVMPARAAGLGGAGAAGSGSGARRPACCDPAQTLLETALGRVDRVQRTDAGTAPGAAATGLEAGIRSQPGGTALSPALRARIEPFVGADLGGVRVHTDSAARAASRELAARAFTYRNHIFLGAGERADDLKLMAHEATHTIQQGAGAGERVQRAGHETETTEAGPAAAEASLPPRTDRSAHEIVILSGGPTSHRMDPDHDANPLNYATAARIRIERLMESAFGDQRQMQPNDRITWAVMRPPYRYRAVEDGQAEEAYIELLRTGSLARLRRAWDALRTRWLRVHPDEAAAIPSGSSAIQLQFVDSSRELVDFMNNGAVGEGRGQASYIGRFEYFGHGAPGQLWLTMGWQHLGTADVTFTNDDIASLDPSVFVGIGEYRSWSCNTATPRGADNESFAQAWVERLGGRFVGAVGRTTYEFIMAPDNPAGSVLLSREEPAHWETVAATGPAPEPAPVSVPETGVGGEASVSTGEPASLPEPGMFTEAEDAGEPVCRMDIMPLEEPASPGDLVCTDEGAGRIDLTVGTSAGTTEIAPAAPRGANCACDKSAVFGYDAQTFGYIRRIAGLIRSAAKDKGVPPVAVAGSIADEYNTRRGGRVALDAAQDALLDSLAEWQIDVDRFFDFDNKLLNAMENDVGMANINVRTALELVQSGELIVPGSPRSSPRVTEIIDFLLTNRGTARTAAAVIGRAQGLFGPHLSGYSQAMREAVLVTYFKQGGSYYVRAMLAVAVDPGHEICPGDGGCRVIRNRTDLGSALS
jgi:hypothetical protein